jgi:hypothetical protein
MGGRFSEEGHDRDRPFALADLRVIFRGMPLEIRSRRDYLIVAVWRNVLVTVGLGAMPIEDLAMIGREHERICERYPGGLCSLTIIPAGSRAGIPNAEFRAAAARMTEEWEPRFLGVARVIEADGFAGSAIRGVVTGIDLVSGTRAPTGVFRARAEAGRWLCERPRQPADVRDGADELCRALVGL